MGPGGRNNEDRAAKRGIAVSGDYNVAGCSDRSESGHGLGESDRDRYREPESDVVWPSDPGREDEHCDSSGSGGECWEREFQGDSEDPKKDAPCATDLAWAAGLFDGEGNVWVGEDGRVQIKVDMMSSRPVWRLEKILGGLVKASSHKNGHLIWRWRECGSVEILRIAGLLIPYMSEKGYELLVACGVIKGTFRADEARGRIKVYREAKKSLGDEK
jgi:hypothetical protein